MVWMEETNSRWVYAWDSRYNFEMGYVGWIGMDTTRNIVSNQHIRG